MTQTPGAPHLTETQTPTWRDLILYLVVGVGGFVAVSLLVGMQIDKLDLTASLIAYALNILFFAGSALVLGAQRGKLDLKAMGLVPPRLSLNWLFIAIAVSLLLIPVRAVVGVLVQFLTGTGLQGLQGRMDVVAPSGFTWLGFIVTLVGAGILVPISEELFFRGALFTWFRQRYNFTAALWASSILFALGHIDTLGVVASSFVLGVVNAWVYERSKTLWAPIVMHITTNSFAVLVIYAALAFAPGSLKM